MVFQLPALFGATVEEATLYGARLAGLVASVKDEAPQSLSVGEQQRVSIARALEPEALLVDEPTSALDEAARRRIEDLIRELNGDLGLAIVLVSHDLDQVERVADRVVLLVAGRANGRGSTSPGGLRGRALAPYRSSQLYSVSVAGDQRYP